MPQSFERETRAGCSRLRTFTPVTRLLLICLSFLCAGPLSAQPNVHMWKVLVDDRCAFPDFRLFRVAHPELLKPIGEPAFAARVPAPDALEQSFAPWERLRNYEQEAMEAHRENGMRRWQFITALDDLYGPDIRAVLRKEGLPESFGFLPLLLTGYDPSFVGEGDRAGLWAQSYIDARAAGLQGGAVLEALGPGAAGSFQLAMLGPKMIAQDFAPGFMLKHFIKDLGIALAEAEGMGLALPGLAQARRLAEMAAATTGDDAGTQAIIAALAVP